MPPIPSLLYPAVGAVAGTMAALLFAWTAGRSRWRDPLLSAGPRRTIVLTLLTAALAAVFVGRTGLTFEGVAFVFFVFVGVQLSSIDLRERLLPNRVVVPSIMVGFALLTAAALTGGGFGSLLRALIGAVVVFVVFLVLALISPRGMGMGDVKFAPLVAMYLAWAGWYPLLYGTLAGFLLAAIAGVIMLLARRAKRSTLLPFGPAMFAGAVILLVTAR